MPKNRNEKVWAEGSGVLGKSNFHPSFSHYIAEKKRQLYLFI